ncbi:MAG: low temperature requirement protein A [Thermoleophilaceae bacterium]
MPTVSRHHAPRVTAVMKRGESVTALELFFDLVFVLALTQCTALMAEDPTWGGLARAMLILGVLWWAWVGYAWLTSVVDPEEGTVRLAMFAAMAAFLVTSLAIPDAFGDLGFLFAGAYAVARVAQIVLFLAASRDEPKLRSSVQGLAVSTFIGSGLLVAAAFTDGYVQGLFWLAALAIDSGGPYFFGVEGWKLVPAHFAERHGLIIIIALGESIVAIGAGAETGVSTGVVVAAVLGVAVAGALWWLYFDVVALVAERRLSNAEIGAEQNAIARDSFSYLHFPMVAGIVLLALALKTTLGHVADPLELVPAVAGLGGTAIYLLAHVAFRYRNVHRFSTQRVAAAVVLMALLPAAVHVPALASLAGVAAVLAALILYERARFAELRERLRNQVEAEATT